jgi:phasin family protein
MFLNKDQISGAAKANLESQFALYADFTSKTLESIEKLVTLNLTATRASMEEAAATTRQILSAKDPQELLSLVAAQAKPNLDKAVAYGGHLANIAAGAQAEFSKLTEAQVARFGQRFSGLVEEVSKNAPAGTENMAAFLKSAFDSASSGYEQFNKTSKQAADVFSANVTAAATQAATAASTAAKA